MATPSVIELINTAAQVISFVHRFYVTTRDAPQEIQSLTRKLLTLSERLGKLHALATASNVVNESTGSKPPWKSLLQLLQASDGAFARCKRALAEISSSLPQDPTKLASRVIWWKSQKDKIKKQTDAIDCFVHEVDQLVDDEVLANIIDIRDTTHAIMERLTSLSQKPIFKWLCPFGMTSTYRRLLHRHQNGTGSWFLNSDLFKQWQASPGFFWVHGFGGCGKTMLSSCIIEELQKTAGACSKSAVLHFHFEFQDEKKHSPIMLLRVMAAQLAASEESDKYSMNAVEDLYHNCLNGQEEPQESKLWHTLNRQMESLKIAYLVVDALDESNDHAKIVAIIRALLTRYSNLHVLALSRREPGLKGLATLSGQRQISIEADTVDSDIRTYVKARLKDPEQFDCLDTDSQNYIMETILRRCNGMFRLAQCHLDTLRSSSLLDLDDVDEILNSLPSEINHAYDRILSQIQEHDRAKVHRILACVAFGHRPFNVSDMECILRIKLNGKDRIQRMRFVRSVRLAIEQLCRSLIVFEATPDSKDDGEGVFKLGHMTVKEYLMSDHLKLATVSYFSLTEGIGNRMMAEICLATILHHDTFDSCGPEAIVTSPFLLYSAKYVAWHAVHANHEEDNRTLLDDLLGELLHTKEIAYQNWHRICDPLVPRRAPDWDCYPYLDAELQRPLTAREAMDKAYLRRPLRYAAHFNLWRTAQRLIALGHDLDARGPGRLTALHSAAKRRSFETAEILLVAGANVDCRDIYKATPLHLAITHLHAEYVPKMVELLVCHGADISATGRHTGTPLQEASYRGQADVVHFFIEQKVNVDQIHSHDRAQMCRFSTALQCAAYNGNLTILELLIHEGGAKVNLISGAFGTALHAAAMSGHTSAVKRLITHGADCTIVAGTAGTVLDAALIGGTVELVKLILSLQEEDGSDTLSHDAKRDSVAEDADVGAMITAARYKMPNLVIAARNGLDPAVETLIAGGADVNLQSSSNGTTALIEASRNGYIVVARLLLDAGAKVDLADRGARIPLHFACSEGHLNMVKLLLAAGSRAYRPDLSARTSVAYAEEYGHTKVAGFLRSAFENREFLDLKGDRYILERCEELSQQVFRRVIPGQNPMDLLNASPGADVSTTDTNIGTIDFGLESMWATETETGIEN